ncbi:MAG: MFS transporter [Spirochaetaceae bacterium]|nr:MFS transporter [Spirochaetaceae bacterium]
MSDKYIRNIILFGHFTVAVAINTLAPLLPTLQAKLGMTIFQSSAIPTAMTISVMVANLLMGVLIAHLGQKKVLILSLIIVMSGTIVGYFANSFILILISFSLIGFACGASFTGLSTIYAGLPIKFQNFGLYHAFFGIGGMITPLLVSFWIKNGRDYHELFFLQTLIVLIALILVMSARSLKNIQYKNFRFREMFSVISSPFIRLGILVLAVYASVEVGCVTWNANMSTDGYGLTPATAGYILSSFWLLFTLSRIFADFIARKIGSVTLSVSCSLLTIAVISLWILGVSPYLSPLLGLLLGPVFPVMQKYINNHLAPEQKGLFNGLSYASTGLTATMIIPIMGSLGDISMIGAFLPVPLVLLVLVFLIGQVKKKTPVENR